MRQREPQRFIKQPDAVAPVRRSAGATRGWDLIAVQ